MLRDNELAVAVICMHIDGAASFIWMTLIKHLDNKRLPGSDATRSDLDRNSKCEGGEGEESKAGGRGTHLDCVLDERWVWCYDMGRASKKDD